MFDTRSFEERLTGGNPNSLGETEEIVDEVINDRILLEDLFQCFFSNKSVVRQRTASAMKRIAKKKPMYLKKYINRLIRDVGKINQDAVQWTLSETFHELETVMNTEQRSRATNLLRDNLENTDNAFVIVHTLDTLAAWSKDDQEIEEWLVPILDSYSQDERPAVSKRAAKLLSEIA